MNRILEFSPSQEEAVVARILVLVHQAVDTHFPAAEQATRQFTKTVFSGEGESTAGVRAAPDGDGDTKVTAFGSDERTSPDGRLHDPDRAPYIPPPPPPGRPAGHFAPVSTLSADPLASHRSMAFGSNLNPLAIGHSDGVLSKSTRLDATMDDMRTRVGLDWTMKITLGALVAGIALLFYFTYKYISLG